MANKKWILVSGISTVLTITESYFVYPFSVYLGRGEREPDKYEMTGLAVQLLLMPICIALAVLTISLCLYRRAEKSGTTIRLNL